MSPFPRLKARLRLCAIYQELGYNPWRKPHTKSRKRKKGVYMGTREAIIPFLNEDAKRTISHLLFRPGYLMRDYIFRGEHERYLAPFTALLVFYSVFTLLVAIVQPDSAKNTLGKGILDSIDEMEVKVDSTAQGAQQEKVIRSVVKTFAQAVLITHLDQYPDAVDTPWKESLAAVLADIRSKGIPLFLGNFLLLWLSMALLLRKYEVSVSGAAAASAYVLCQFCVFMFLALLLTFGKSYEVGLVILAILLFIDYRQWLPIGNKTALGLTLKTGLVYLAAAVLFYILLGTGLVLFALHHA